MSLRLHKSVQLVIECMVQQGKVIFFVQNDAPHPNTHSTSGNKTFQKISY